MWYLSVDACVTCCVSVECDAMQTRMRSRVALKDESNACGDVLCLRVFNAVKRNGAVESSAGKARAKDDVCFVISWVLSLVVVPGESGSSTSGELRGLGMYACKVLASPWSSVYRLRGWRWWQRWQASLEKDDAVPPTV